MYQKYNWPSGKERKFVQLNANQRIGFATEAKKLCDAHPEVGIHAIVVKKQNVWPHIRKDGNKLYNYMIRLALLKKMAAHDLVTFVPDPRSMKVQSGNSLPDYLQTELWFTEKAITTLINKPEDSAHSRGIQFADMVAGIVQSRFETNDDKALRVLIPRMKLLQLFF
jgi:hypothetical protein